MKKRILAYVKKIDDLLADETEHSKKFWQKNAARHLEEMKYFEHERLVHLLVTLAFAIMTVFSVGVIVVSGAVYFAALTGLLLLLLIPYVNHYYLLENNVQKMHDQYVEMLARIDMNKKGKCKQPEE